MIQRPQTLYLLIGAFLLVLFFALSGAWADAASAAAPALGVLAYVLATASAVVSLGAVFLYKTRERQRTVIGVAMWMVLALVLVVAVGLFLAQRAPTPGAEARYLVSLLPLGAYLSLRMARRGVQKDVDLVRSMDRLR
ncbi:MAG: DUF4293 family protein [Rubricoccaceae bacterium]